MKAESDDICACAPNPSQSMNGSEISSRKRTYSSSSDDERNLKVAKLSEYGTEEGPKGPDFSKRHLLSLSDDVLLIIMSYLHAVDLMSLRKSCQRLSEVASDWSLWVNVEFRPSILEEKDLFEYVPLLRETTERVATRGFVSLYPTRTQCLSKELLSKIGSTCHTLKAFIAEEHFIDANELKISYFPSSIKHLSLKGSKIAHLPTDCSYFLNIQFHLPHLQIVELTDCSWMPSHSIMALSKLPHLEELRLDGCRRLRDCIAYASLAFNLGFHKLQVLDLRRTGFSDSELPAANKYNRLTHLYLERSGGPNGGGGALSPSRSSTGSSDDEWDNEVNDAHSISDNGLRSLVFAGKSHSLHNHMLINRSNEIIVSSPSTKDRSSLCRLHTLVVRNFPRVTDATLDEMRYVRTLRFLDVTGTEVSMSGVNAFLKARPDVTLVTSFDNVT